MKIRELIRQRKRKYEIGAYVFCGFVVSGMLVEYAFSLENVRVWRVGFTVASIAGGFALFVAIYFLYRCPCCDGFLSPNLRVGPFKLNSPFKHINNCPSCGVQLDGEFRNEP